MKLYMAIISSFFSVLLLLLYGSRPALACFPPDRAALLSFPPSLAGYGLSFINSSSRPWGISAGVDCCSWEGVTCSSSSGAGGATARRVTGLSVSLTYEGLPADRVLISISPRVCNLSALARFTLTLRFSNVEPDTATHNLRVPECMGTHLTLLNFLRVDIDAFLRDSPLSMELGIVAIANVPASLSRLSHLQEVQLTALAIGSHALLSLLSLPHLTTLFLSGCTIPPGFLPLFTSLPATNITSLTLRHCSLSGPLPPFNNTPLLQELQLDHNLQLTSTLDDFVLHSHLPLLKTLSLSFNSLSGSIPSSIGQQFPKLEYLNLESNNIGGTISTNPRLFPEGLQMLFLGDNHISGPFPTLDSSRLLSQLHLSGNLFLGALPEEWRYLLLLESLTLGGSHIAINATSGQRLPGWLFRLPRLADLDLSSTGIQPNDCMCDGKFSMLNQTLNYLSLPGNKVTGMDILNCFALHNFTQPDIYLDLSHNPLSFALSARAQLSPHIYFLDLSGCSLHGPLTVKFTEQLMRLREDYTSVLLRNNSLSGSVPIPLMSHLFSLDLSYNGFTHIQGMVKYNQSLGRGSIFLLSHNFLKANVSSVFSSMRVEECPAFELQELDLSYNLLAGEIPSQALCALSKLDRLLLNHNLLVGKIPKLGGGVTDTLSILKLSNNQLTGNIPTSILSITSLKLLDLSYNQLEGDFGTLFTSMKHNIQLRVLLLSHNRINGSIPLSFGVHTPALQLVDLSANTLSGSIPQYLELQAFSHVENSPFSVKDLDNLYEEVQVVEKGIFMYYPYELQVLTSLDLSDNLLEGTIPLHLGDLVGMRYLNLSRNRLSRSIPSSLSKLQVLESMDLSWNELEGRIPSDFSNLSSLEVFDVSFNRALEGRIPAGAAFSSSASFRGDPSLCGDPAILEACNDTEMVRGYIHGSGEEGDKDEHFTFFERMKEWIALPGLCIGISVGFGGTLWVLHVKRVFNGRCFRPTICIVLL